MVALNRFYGTWSITGIACRACHLSGTFFSLWHTHTHTAENVCMHTTTTTTTTTKKKKKRKKDEEEQFGMHVKAPEHSLIHIYYTHCLLKSRHSIPTRSFFFFSFFNRHLYFISQQTVSGQKTNKHTYEFYLSTSRRVLVLRERLPYCYYYLRVLYFANFCDLEKIAKLSTRKNFYQHIRHVI